MQTVSIPECLIPKHPEICRYPSSKLQVLVYYDIMRRVVSLQRWPPTAIKMHAEIGCNGVQIGGVGASVVEIEAEEIALQ